MSLTDGNMVRAQWIGRSRVVREVDLKRIYERLRKRSLRLQATSNDEWNAWLYSSDDFPSYDPPPHWTVHEHEAYVKGVRDALQAVDTR